MITRVRIANFKSFSSFECSLGRNNVFVGANMSGKSNLLDAFQFLQDLLRPSQAGTFGTYSALNPRNGFRELAWKGGSAPNIELHLTGSSIEGTSEAAWSYSLVIAGSFEWNTANIKSEELSVTVDSNQTMLIRTEGNSRKIFDAAGKQLTEVSDTTRLALELNFPNWAGNTVRNFVLGWRFYNLVPPLMKQGNPTAAPNSLNVLGDNLSAWLMLLQTRHPEAFERIRSVATDVLPGLKSVFTTPTQQSTVFVSSNEAGLVRPISVWQMSDGELVFIAFLSLIFSPHELGGTVTFIEEPERHLHPKLISELIDVLRQVQGELQPAIQSQIVVTTHSPHLIDKFDIDELIVLAKQEGATSVIRPSNKEHLRKIITDEGIGLGELYYSGALNFA